MERGANEVTAGGERSVGAGGNVGAAATGDHSTATYIHNQYVQQQPPADELTPEEITEALRRYATRIRETYGRLDLEVLIPTEEGEHPPVGLDEVFVAPTVRADPPPVELPRDIRQRLVDAGEWPSSLPPGLERETLDRAREAYAERPARGVLEVLADPDQDRLVLLGDPGAGKSTLARHLSLTLTREVPSGDPLEALAGRLPLVVELREYAAGEWREQTFEDFLKHLHDTKGMAPPSPVTERLLAEGRAVVVFDGLDELFDPAAREQVSHRIADFAGRHSAAGVRVIVTSRVIGYRRGVLERADFAHHMIQDLDRERIGQFARQWYTSAYPHDEERAARLCRRLTDAVSSSRPVAELAGNPLLLTILAIIGRRRELPRDRQGVYRHAVAVLIAHWDEHAKHLRAPTDAEALSYLGDEDRHELLRLVARQMQDGEGGIAGNHIHQDVLLTTFKRYLCEQYELPVAQAVSAARTMVRQFRERNFILSHYGGGVYGFVHRAFLEYLAAEDIDRRYTRYREWTPDELIEQVFGRHAEDPAWHEVLLLLVGQLGEPEAAAAIDRLLDMHWRRTERTWDAELLLLSVRALAEVRRIGALAPQSRNVVDGIIAFLEKTMDRYVVFAVTEGGWGALTTFPPHWSGRSRLLRWFHLRGQFDWHASRSAQIIAGMYQDSELPRRVAAHGSTEYTRVRLLEMLAERWGADEDVHELLRARAVEDPSEEVRRTALELLVEQGIDRPGVGDLILDRSLFDPSLRVRGYALSLRDDPEADGLWDQFVQVASSEGRLSERVAAVDQLTKYRSDDPEVLALLFCLATDAADATDVTVASLREEVVRSLADLVDDERVPALMRDRAIEDPDEDVRRTALLFVAEALRDWEFVRARAVDDEDPAVRTDALYALHDLRADEPDTWELARRRAVADPDEFARSAAYVVLWQSAGSEAGTWEFLRDRVIEDPDGEGRDSALTGLVRLRADEAETWELVRERLVEDAHQSVRASALGELCKHKGHEAGTWESVLDRLRNDPSVYVRETALYATRHYRSHEDTWAAIRERVSEDADGGVRQLALALLATNRSDDAVTLQLIRDRAATDPVPRVRADALRWRAVCETDEDTVEFMRDRAVADPDPEPRVAALQSLAFGWPAHPRTLPLLRERAGADEDEGVRAEAARALAAAEALAPLADQLP
ncbi:HEAT repeat domain-containing protein [Streptomyces cylindrosporus]|uniref:HEAT repeat domain-containing protein n=1 Tax=Streptomyces cylindrosporus TaxID=2927583 RepID=A0ABS9YNY0_9ACTN|nr:HEAT repeat domain-containing protein [Streptomyces cylindrosporus]MCI3278844.1 HEAT repeat domain-containing protein [Streptomyces cylindrosporus]